MPATLDGEPEAMTKSEDTGMDVKVLVPVGSCEYGFADPVIDAGTSVALTGADEPGATALVTEAGRDALPGTVPLAGLPLTGVLPAGTELNG